MSDMDRYSDRLFIGCFPTGLSYADRSREENGDFMRIAFISYATLKLEWRAKRVPADLRKQIEAHAKKLQARKGEQYEVSSCGQTVTLGGDS